MNEWAAAVARTPATPTTMEKPFVCLSFFLTVRVSPVPDTVCWNEFRHRKEIPKRNLKKKIRNTN